MCVESVQMQKRDAQARDVKLVGHVAGSCDGVLELSGGVRCVARVFVNPQFGRTCVPRQSQLPRLGGTVMASPNSVLGQKRLFRATAFDEARRCDRGPHM